MIGPSWFRPTRRKATKYCSMAHTRQAMRKIPFSARICPGGMIVIPPLVLRALGGDPGKISVEVKANRLVLGKRLSPVEARLAKFKARLAEQLRQATYAERHQTPAELTAEHQTTTSAQPATEECL